MNRVVHFELPSEDQARAGQFYQDCFGWQITARPEMKYTLAMTTESDDKTGPIKPGAINGGIFDRSADLPAPSLSIDVPDIDAALEKITAAGGSLVREKVSVGDMGYVAYFKDTEGNVLSLWQNAN